MLQAICFCVAEMGFYPRLAPENDDNAEPRLGRIIALVRGSKFAIHDLSRCKSTAAEQYARMNMPFELGIDHGCRQFGRGRLRDKMILVLEAERYDYQRALSDISGWDIRVHSQDYQKAVRRVRDWLILRAGAQQIGATQILGEYVDFQEWYWERELTLGASEDDIREYPTNIVLRAMHQWIDAGKPV